jgi:23S rRNA (cytosine1962-C5)-methyltransferase
VLRLSRNLQNYADLGLTDGEVIYGELQNETVVFIEHHIYFSANVIKGHKTGYFLDHRENRKLVGAMSKSKTVLDVFSYTGGFSVHALANGANEVTSIDISQKALEVASQNAKLNNYSGIHKTICGDAFKELNQLINKHKVFDVVVIDPPSFAKRQSEIELAKKKYKELAILGLKLTSKNGILVLASCSSRVTSRSFFDINKGVFDKSGRSYNIINKTSHDSDHPISFPEAEYLKCGYYKLNS